jgi:hypothetical protein
MVSNYLFKARNVPALLTEFFLFKPASEKSFYLCTKSVDNFVDEII